MKIRLHSSGQSLALGRTLGRAPAWAVAISVAVAFATAGCTGKGGSGGAQENPSQSLAGGAPTSSGAGTSNPAGKGPTGSTSGSSQGSTAKNLPVAVDRIIDRAHAAESATYTATYRVRMADGAKATSRLAQRPPKFGFEIDQGKQRNVVVFDGKLMHGCLLSGSGWRCTKTTFDDTTEVGNSYPGAVLHLIDALTAVVGREVRAGTTSRTVLGARVSCATFTSTMENPPPAQVLCVRRDGVLAYARTADGQVVELTGFKASVDARNLVPPA